MRRWVSSSLFPNICLLCDQVCPNGANIDLCTHCRSSLPWNERCCSRCAVPMNDIPGSNLCAQCSVARPAFEHCVVPLRYEGEVRSWVRRLKFHQGLVEARVLGTLLAEAVLEGYLGGQLPDALVPVPLSLRRLAGRGHNQALSLATIVARHVDRPVNRTRVTRVRHGPSQQALSREQRQSNLIGAFASGPWQGARLAVIDDVMTTGATLAELAATLLAAGASEVHAWCAARTPDLARVFQAH
ncbi:MAG: double zinc ribbon domain-containing protein [Gammaproteobacteria bacterium]|nr:double zinc ribbon domain-containing protein [Gammaproteobacteria bacterium]